MLFRSNDTATTEIYTLSLHDALPISPSHEAWHDDHAFADLCPICHGGHGDADDLAGAHDGLVDPLVSAGGQCISCHGADTQTFLERYTRAQGADAGAGAAPASTSPSLRSRAPEQPAHGESGPNLAMIGIVVGVGAIASFFVARNERHRRLDQAASRAVSVT